MTKLTELNPEWLGGGGEGIGHVLPDGTTNWNIPPYTGGITFDCPCGRCGKRCTIIWKNPPESGIPGTPFKEGWNRISGTTFDDLTLKPSIYRNPKNGGCGWHGFITDGHAVLA